MPGAFDDLVPKAAAPAPALRIGAFDDLTPKAAPPPSPRPAKPGLAEQAKTDFLAPMKGAFDDLIRDVAPPKTLPAAPKSLGAFATQAAGNVGKNLKSVADVANLAVSPISGVVNTISAPIERATRPPPDPIFGQKPGLNVGAALMGLGPEGRVGAVRVPRIPEAPVTEAAKAVPRAKAPAAPKDTALAIPEKPATTGGAFDDLVPKKPVEGIQRTVAKIFAPSTLSEEAGATARISRRVQATRQLEADQAANTLLKHESKVGNLPVEQQRSLIQYVEGRSKQPKLRLADPKMQAAADTMRDVYGGYRKRIEYALGEDGPTFINDYYSHLWKEKPSQVADTLNTFMSRQGSGRSLKARSIPTIEEGIAAGLTPRVENPIQATILYAQNMSRYLATHDFQNELENAGQLKWHAPGQQPAGWAPIDGIRSERARGGFVPEGSNTGDYVGGILQKRYAPEDVARIYNRAYSRGFESGDARDVWVGMREASNAMTMLKLGLSGYHGLTMANEAVISEAARGVGAAARGKFGTAAKALGGAVAAPVRSAVRGQRMGRELLGVRAPDAFSEKVNAAYVRSGGRLKMDQIYRARASGSFYQALKRGTLKRELGDAAKRIYGDNPSMLDRAKGVIDLAGDTIQAVSAPLFEDYIPAVKRGAFAHHMEDFLHENPMASQDAIDHYATKLQDTIDNRFGELVQDNMFWHRQMKQLAHVIMLSPGWNIGTVREIVGGLADMPGSAKSLIRGKGISMRTGYVAALAGVTALEGAIITYLATGSAPKGRDFLAGRTGGTDVTSGEPERVMLPGYQKDVYAVTEAVHNGSAGVLQELNNKLNPALSTAIDELSNKDWRGLPIRRPPGVAPSPEDPSPMDDVIERFSPISIGQLGKRKVGTNIPAAAAVLGVRPAPGYITSPERTEALRTKYNTLDWRKKLKADARAKARLENGQ